MKLYPDLETPKEARNKTEQQPSPPYSRPLLNLIKVISDLPGFFFRIPLYSSWAKRASWFFKIYSTSSRLCRLHKSRANETNVTRLTGQKLNYSNVYIDGWEGDFSSFQPSDEIDRKEWLFLFLSRLDSSLTIKNTKKLSSSASNFIAHVVVLVSKKINVKEKSETGRRKKSSKKCSGSTYIGKYFADQIEQGGLFLFFSIWFACYYYWFSVLIYQSISWLDNRVRRHPQSFVHLLECNCPPSIECMNVTAEWIRESYIKIRRKEEIFSDC
jgi:hypothetical protein